MIIYVLSNTKIKNLYDCYLKALQLFKSETHSGNSSRETPLGKLLSGNSSRETLQNFPPKFSPQKFLVLF